MNKNKISSYPHSPLTSIIPLHEGMLNIKTPTYTGSWVLEELLETSSRITPGTAPQHHWGKAAPGLGRQGNHYCKCLHSFILRLQSITLDTTSPLTLTSSISVLCSSGWLLHFHNLHSTKYCYQRPHAAKAQSGIIWLYFLKEKKNNKNPHKNPHTNPQNTQSWWWPTCNTAPEDLSSPREGAGVEVWGYHHG